MVVRIAAAAVFATVWSILCTFLAKYELNKVYKKLKSSTNNEVTISEKSPENEETILNEIEKSSQQTDENADIEDKTFDKKQHIMFGVITTILNIMLALALVYIYKDTPVVEHIKRLGLIGLIEIAAVTDRKYNIIPNDLIKVGLALRAAILICEIFMFRMSVLSILISDAIGILAVVIIVILCLLFMKGSVGMGDLKLMMLMALCQGIDGFTASGMMSLIAAFFAAVYYLITKKKGRKDSMAFAPFLAVGTYLGVFLTGL